MLEFKKYSSIENNFNKEFMEHVVAEMPTDLQYVVQEKVHGANTSFLCDGISVQFAKRTSPLAPNEKFYDYPELLERYKNKVIRLFNRIKGQYPEVTHISVFGEMFGGQYPHKDIKDNLKISLIQKGIYYTPIHEFYGFDIYLFGATDNRFLPVEDVNKLFESEGFLYAKTLFQGKLKECLQYPNTFQTNIPAWLGLPPIKDNICEGVVIRPIVPMYFHNGSRVLIKNKNERFAEKKNKKKSTDKLCQPATFSAEFNKLMETADEYITENRLANVVSHIGEINMPKDFAKVMGLFSKDTFDDFLKEHNEQFQQLEKFEQKQFTKQLNKLTSNLVRKVYMSNAPTFE